MKEEEGEMKARELGTRSHAPFTTSLGSGVILRVTGVFEHHAVCDKVAGRGGVGGRGE